MNRKTLLFIAASFLLLFVSFEGFSVPSVRAARTWIVGTDERGDFSVIQDAINAASPRDVITVSSGIFYEHVTVNKSVTLIGESGDTIIDGNGTGTVVAVDANSVHISGFTIQRSGDQLRGVFLDGSSDSTIQDCIIVDNYYGVWLNNSERTLITDNLIQGNTWGIYLQGSGHNIIERNTLAGNYRRGLHLVLSDHNTVDGNSVTDHVEAIYLEYSSNNLLRNNNLTDNTYGFGVSGSELSHFVQDVDASNVMDGKPIIYWVNEHDKQVPANASFVAVVNSTGITVAHLNLTHHQEGLLFAYTTNSTIENVHISNARCGFRLVSCNGLRVSDNMLDGNAKGIRLDYSVDNAIQRNTIVNSHEGIFLDHASNNILSGNMVADNIKGMFVYYSTHNIIYHNNFVNNEKHVFIALHRILVSNSWDWGGEGNFWSGQVGREYEEDGISNASYILDQTNKDGHPLMGLFSGFMVVSEDTPEHIEAICNSTIADFEFDSLDKVISFSVAGPTETIGFCRLTIPHRLLDGSYEVLVDGSPPLTLKELASSNSTHTALYFTYEHSTRTVTIVPEYSLVSLFLSAVAVLIVTVICRLSRMTSQEPKDLPSRTELLNR